MSVTYESIVLLREDEARETLGILDQQGEAAALSYLKQWHEPGEGTLASSPGNLWKNEDSVYEEGKYVMYHNRQVPYIGLACKVSLDPTDVSESV